MSAADILTRRFRQFAALAAILMSLLSGGCAAPGAMPVGGEPQLLEDIKAGRVVLDCSITCGPIYIFNQATVWKKFQSSDWQGLGIEVAKSGWRQDITYFLLGVSAEGMGAYEAAARYYRMAGALATGRNEAEKCSSIKNLCHGLVFPGDIRRRLDLVNVSLQKQNLLRASAWALANNMPDAPQTLLATYAAERFTRSKDSNGEQALGQALLEHFDPTSAASTRSNEIARPKAIAALKEKLAARADEERMALGMWLQLKEYDQARRGFPLRYPLHAPGSPAKFSDAIFQGASQLPAGARGYSAQGGECAWEPQRDYPAGDTPGAYFALLSACIQHPADSQRSTSLPHRDNLLPPYFFLYVPGGSLWSRLPIEEGQAEALLRRIGPQRRVWAELVFDVRTIDNVRLGLFGHRETVDTHKPGMDIAIHPRALVIWDSAPEPGRRGAVLAILGDHQEQGLGPDGRLLRSLVSDRSYDGIAAAALPSPNREAVSAKDSEHKRSSASLSAQSPNRSSRIQSRTRSAPKVSSAEDSWIDPPPARR